MSANKTPARLIVVEDSFPIAHSLKSMLQTMSCDVVGMAGDIRRALDLVATVGFDLALLDIDLHGEHVGAVADAVLQLGKPVIFLSGYGDADILPTHLRALPLLEKPVDRDALFAAIAAALTSRT
jgi:DNA-binding NtrC family response regulator